MRQNVASFANFICKFGEKDLIDYAKSIVIPAFTDTNLVRKFGNTSFLLYDVRLTTLDNDAKPPVVALTGVFIKDTQLTREQLLDGSKGLVKSNRKMRSSPSAFFILILNNHRLVYFPQTKHAPTLEMFRSTLSWRLKRKHVEFIGELYEEQRGGKYPTTKKALYSIHPIPALEIIPISGGEEIRKFVERYELLKRIDFRLVETNNEVDGGRVFNDIREYLSEGLGAKSTKIGVSNPKGLDKNAAVERVEAATETSNQEVTLYGIDGEGNELRGDNNHFRVSAPIEQPPNTRGALTRQLFNTFKHLVEEGVIKIGEPTRNLESEIKKIID